jgi:hypothetical protein
MNNTITAGAVLRHTKTGLKLLVKSLELNHNRALTPSTTATVHCVVLDRGNSEHSVGTKIPLHQKSLEDNLNDNVISITDECVVATA